MLGVVATESRRSFALDAAQTPRGLSTEESGLAYSRIDFYLEQITDCLDKLPQVRLYTALVNSEHFKRDLRLVIFA